MSKSFYILIKLFNIFSFVSRFFLSTYVCVRWFGYHCWLCYALHFKWFRFYMATRRCEVWYRNVTVANQGQRNINIFLCYTIHRSHLTFEHRTIKVIWRKSTLYFQIVSRTLPAFYFMSVMTDLFVALCCKKISFL